MIAIFFFLNFLFDPPLRPPAQQIDRKVTCQWTLVLQHAFLMDFAVIIVILRSSLILKRIFVKCFFSSPNGIVTKLSTGPDYNLREKWCWHIGALIVCCYIILVVWKVRKVFVVDLANESLAYRATQRFFLLLFESGKIYSQIFYIDILEAKQSA